MKKIIMKKKMILICSVLCLLLLPVLIVVRCKQWREMREEIEPGGVYAGHFKNRKDTLWLYSDGRFRQRIYDKNNTLLYDAKSRWRKTKFNIIGIDSVCLWTDDVNLLDTIYRYTISGSPNAAICYSIKDKIPVLYFSYFVDLPETYIYYYRIKKLDGDANE